LNDHLEVRARAIKNWQKLRLLLVLMMICGRSVPREQLADSDEELKDGSSQQKPSCKQRIAPYIIDPRNKYKLMWEILICSTYMVTFV